MKPDMPIGRSSKPRPLALFSLTPTLPRMREREQMNRYASFVKQLASR